MKVLEKPKKDVSFNEYINGPKAIPMKILFFIGDLGIGGKERRLVELLGYLKNKREYELLVVTTKEGGELPKFLDLGIDKIVLKEKPFISKFNYFLHLYKIVKKFNPDIIHTWGRMQTFYTLPTALLTKTKLVNGQITSAPPKISFIDSLIDKVNFRYSDIILSNSQAGVEVLNPPRNKAAVIYNGLDLNRFVNLPDISSIKDKYQVKTRYLILMVANFTPNKDYEKFFRLGQILTEQRKDLTCMGVGYFEEDSDLIKSCRDIIGDNSLLRIQPETTEVEALVKTCDIGLLFSNTAVHGEGISNAVIEYMALAKPVVANDAGGTKEVVINNKTGYLIQNESLDQIAKQINDLLAKDDLRCDLGRNGRDLIQDQFILDKMGIRFESVYTDILA